MNLEINFYLSEEDLDFKGNEIKQSLQNITEKIFKDNFLNNENFNFYLTKKSKINKESLQTENV
jgi:5S rRNA maturation endonuclease (ribonuclease M5)